MGALLRRSKMVGQGRQYWILETVLRTFPNQSKIKKHLKGGTYHVVEKIG
jgi:hypothetical protein